MLELHSQDITEISKALAIVQKTLDRAAKSTKNEFLSTKYADLTTVWNCLRDILPDNGFSVTQVMSPIDGKDYLVTILFHTSGQWIKSIAPLVIEKLTSQNVGKAITYQRRYSLAAIVGVCQEDDDGNESTFISRKQVVAVQDVLKGHPDIYSQILRQLKEKKINTFDKILICDYDKLLGYIQDLITKKLEKQTNGELNSEEVNEG